MAKQVAKVQTKNTHVKKRRGVHAKSVNSKLKKSKNYTKKYNGQGR